MNATAPDLGVIVAREHDPELLRRRMRRGEIERVFRGVYREIADRSPSGASTRLDPTLRPDIARELVEQSEREAQRLPQGLWRLQSAAATMRSGFAFSHESAALLHRLRLWSQPTSVSVRAASNASRHPVAGIERHQGCCESVVSILGLPVASIYETVVDCLCALGPFEGLVVADSALAKGLIRSDLVRLLDQVPGRRGVAKARRVLALADGGAASHWETWLRYVCLRLGLPQPQTQFEIRVDDGRLFRVDLCWPQFRVILEFDGAFKYDDNAFGSGRTGREVLTAEKRRDEAILHVFGARPEHVMAVDARGLTSLEARILDLFPAQVREAARRNRYLPPPPRLSGAR
jgi:predicted transcriptional regulator of viral defense system